MQIELVKKDDKVVGWKLIAENEEDRLKMGSVRNMCFFGMGGDVIAYNGVTPWKEDPNYVQELQWIKKKHHSDYKDNWVGWEEDEKELEAWRAERTNPVVKTTEDGN